MVAGSWESTRSVQCLGWAESGTMHNARGVSAPKKRIVPCLHPPVCVIFMPLLPRKVPTMSCACHADHPNWQLLIKTACNTSSCIFFTGPSTWSWRVLGASRAAEVRPFHSSPVCTSYCGALLGQRPGQLHSPRWCLSRSSSAFHVQRGQVQRLWWFECNWCSCS